MAGHISFEAAKDLLVGISFGSAFVDVVACLGMVRHPGNRDHVQGAVQRSVFAAVEPVPDRVSR